MAGQHRVALIEPEPIAARAAAPAEAAAKAGDLLENIHPQWRTAFTRFVETGEAEEEFLAYLDCDAIAQSAVQTAFDAQVDSFQKMVDDLKRLSSRADVEKEAEGATVGVSSRTSFFDRARSIASWLPAFTASSSDSESSSAKKDD